MASREAWEFEVHTGIGGKRKLYKVPEKYITFIRPRPDAPTSAPSLAPVVATVAAGGRADPKILSWTVKALEEWAAVNNVQLDPERKGALIAVLYDYVTRGAGTDEVKTLLGAMK